MLMLSNCSRWEKRTGWGSIIKPHYGAPKKQVLHELCVHHVDRALGFDTVPAGKLVSLSKDFWGEIFAPHVCSTQNNAVSKLKILENHMNGGRELQLLDWLQEALVLQGMRVSAHYNSKDAVVGNWNVTSSQCGKRKNDSNQQVVLDPTMDALQSSSDYYKFMITL